MTLARWKEEYSVCLPEVDAQHKKFFELINKLAETPNGDRQVLASVLKELIDYAIYHFAAEERILAEHHYPELADHKERHRKFITKAVLVKNDFDGGKEINPNQVLDWAGAWLIHHILKRDQQYVPYISDN